MKRPATFDLKMARYILRKKLSRRSHFPFTTMIEPLEACNLRCQGCGRIREYEDVLDRRMSVDEAMAAVQAAGSPVVSVSGGEPLLYEPIDDLVRALVEDKRFVFLCTNGLLLEEKLDLFKPSPYLAFVAHMDGTAEVHDQITGRPGSYDIVFSAIREAIRRGFRVNTNTTIFHGSNVEDLHKSFDRLKDVGIEGLMVSAGYAYEDVGEREQFLQRQEAIQVFRRVLDPALKLPFYNNPLYLDFLRGKRTYDCAAWTTPTYTVRGWRLPCYLIADEHVDSIDALFDPALWERYGPGKDKRCANCMIHSSFEGASILASFRRPWDLLRVAWEEGRS
ncbi:adenosyl-hopene transferase HpnH [Candidatus Bipolaricaulota bacterium]|nr:adenosyl-hopene transferase HpnH [Candidatus Bipolaricaulota bacterium]